MTRPPPSQFDRYAHDYDGLHRESIRASGEEPQYFAAYKAAYIERALRESTPPQAILDFGCGIGGMLGHVLRAFPQAVLHGTDVSEESLEIARSTFPAVNFALNEEGALPLADASIDMAYAACVFHHIPPEDRARWAAELKRVLRPGGHLFIFEHNPLNPLTRKVVRDCPFDEDAILLPARESKDLLADAGFVQNRLEYVVFFPKVLGMLRPLERFMGFLPLGAQYALHGQIDRPSRPTHGITD